MHAAWAKKGTFDGRNEGVCIGLRDTAAHLSGGTDASHPQVDGGDVLESLKADVLRGNLASTSRKRVCSLC